MPVGLGYEIALPSEIAYTKHQRRKEAKQSLPLASNAVLKNDNESSDGSIEVDLQTDTNAWTENSSAESSSVSETSSSDSRSSSASQGFSSSSISSTTTTSSSLKPVSKHSSRSSISDEQLDAIFAVRLPQSIAVLPQYVTTSTTMITISEASFPHRSSNFTVTAIPYSTTSTSSSEVSLDKPESSGTGTSSSDKALSTDKTPPSPDSEPILTIHRDRPSLSHRHIITMPTDTTFTSPLLTIRRRTGHLPLTHSLIDPTDTRIGDVQGDFSAPFSGSKATMIFTNAYTNHPTRLGLHGSWYNRRAVIRDEATDEVVASMSSEVFTWKNALAGRRCYDVRVRAGVDIVAIVAMVIALDDRAE